MYYDKVGEKRSLINKQDDKRIGLDKSPEETT